MSQEKIPYRTIPVRDPMSVAPVTLTGYHVCMVPLSFEHLEPLCAIGLEEELWRWSPLKLRTAEHMRAYLAAALREQTEGMALPFATTEKATGRVVGCTRFGNIDTAHRRMEIGWTWIGIPWQRTVVNTEAKYLMLQHAFETLGCVRIELKTDALNQRSRQAILRLGAKEEGTFRNHMITDEGRLRHSVYFSIIDEEWPQIKVHLQRKLGAPYPHE